MSKSKKLHHIKIRSYVTANGERRVLYYIECVCWDGKTRVWPAGDNLTNALKLRDLRLGQNVTHFDFEAEKLQARAKTFTLKPWSVRWLDLHKHKRSIDKDHLQVARLLSYFGDCPLGSITAAKIEDYKAHRLSEQTRYKRLTKPATVNHELALLRSLLIQAVREDVLIKRPQIAMLEEHNKRQRTASLDEYKAILKALAPHFRSILVVLWELGLRTSEAVNLIWSQVDFRHEVLFLGKTKAGENELIPMSPTVKKELSTLYEHRPGSADRVFLGSRGESITRFTLQRAFRAACTETEIHGLWVHDFRGTFITRKTIEEGFDRELVKQITRHRSSYAFDRYVRPTDAQVRAVVNAKPNMSRTQKTHNSHPRSLRLSK